MTTRKLRYVLPSTTLAVIGYCLWGLIVDGAELQELRAEQERLERLVGRLEIHDPTKISVISIEHGEPGELAWRIRLPSGVGWSMKHQIVASGGGSSHHTAKQEPVDVMVRCRLLGENGRWRLCLVRSNGSASNSVPAKLGQFLQRHWQDLNVSAAGQDEQLDADVSRVVTLLSVEVPEKLIPQAKEQIGAYGWNRLKTEPLLLIEVGSQKAFQAREQAADTASGAGAHG